MNENQIAKEVVDAAVKVHTKLGPGLLESVYEEALAYELKKLGIIFDRQIGIPISYEGIRMDLGFRADLVIDNKLIVELKSIENILPVHKKQLLTYLKLTKMRLGLLVNFNVELIKEGIIRIANGL